MNTPTQQPSPVAADAISECEREILGSETRWTIEIQRAFAKLRAALASRSQEPDAWMVICGDLREAFRERLDARRYAAECLQKFGVACEIKPLYTAPQSAAAQGWLPIESAPKDGVEGRLGTPILLYCDPGIVSGRHYGGDSWVTQHDICEHVHSPTHWMPLPAAPQPASAPTGEGE